MSDSDLTDRKRFLVSCHDCRFERSVEGRSGAVELAASHRGGTDHDVVAVEMPRTNAGSHQRLTGPR